MAGKRASPGTGRGIGDNSGLPSHADVRTALAIEMVFEEEEKKLRERKKRARKRIEAMGIRLDDLGDLKSMRDLTGSEIEARFRRQWHLAGAIHADKYEQLDIFSPKSEPVVRAAHFTMGLLAGLQGKELEIPPLVVGDDRQQMIDGHNEGRERRKQAETDILAEAAGGKPADKPTDGTPSAVSKRAAEDFAKDQGDDPLVVAGQKYPNMRQANAARKRLAVQAGADPEPEGDDKGDEPNPDTNDSAPIWASYPADNADWSDEQRSDFAAWFDTVPDTAPVSIGVEYPGALAEFKRLRDASTPDFAAGGVVTGETSGGEAGQEAIVPLEEAGGKLGAAKAVARPDFHAWPDDWLEWTGAQQMEFRRWFESLPENVTPAITHEGAVGYYNALKEERELKRLAGPDEEESTPSLPGPQTAETPDPEEVEAAAKKLLAGDFVPPEKKARRRNPVKA